HIGALLASLSTYKLDTVCAALIGLDKDKVPTLEAAVRRGLAPAEHTELSICGPLAELTLSDFDHVAVHNSLLFAGNGKNPLLRAFSAVGGKLLISRPKLHASECVGCGVCAGICPAKAIVIENKLAVIDKSKCIRCFCCQEFCPKGAMKVKRPLVAKIAAKL
ncbi:MAG: 4Fe-4S binding protein, partial [Oscillospiraceae bacterium]|nr:4Fe-4S binding protein [Oscillospiraceae bacterium]